MANFNTDFQRPQDSFRFSFGGVNTRDVPDALPPGKYSAAVNIRSTGSNGVRTRPGYVSVYQGGNNAVTDIRGYATLSTDSLPRFLSRDANGGVWLDNGASVGNLAGNAGYGASLVTFRPSESPQSWMYIGAQGDYQKFSAPDANNAVTAYKVGIAEARNAVDAGVQSPQFTDFTGGFNNWNVAGTASGFASGLRSNENIGIVVHDPIVSNRQYAQIFAAYSPGELVVINNATQPLVQESWPAIPSNNMVIKTIRYAAGNTGNCVIVPSQTALTGGVLAGFHRGSLLNIGNNEVVAVLGVVPGPAGNFAFLTSTNSTWAANNSIQGLASITVDSATGFNANQNIVSSYFSANIATGVGTITQVFANNSNPFGRNMGASPFFAQQDDYVHLSVSVSDPTQLNEILVLFSLEPGGNNYAGDAFYYSVRPGDLVQIASGNQTVIDAILSAAENEVIGGLPTPGNIAPPTQSSAGNNQWTEVQFPISALTRLGGSHSRSLTDCTGVQLVVNAANNISFKFGSMWVGGGSAPDVGNNGAFYQYQCVPLSSLTGVRGNPTPIMRYGVDPRRQSVLVKTSALNNAYDPQIDTWELYRYGGSVNSYRFIGTTAVGQDFLDTFFDSSAEVGNPLPIDNTEPWPSIDVPYRANNATAFGQQLIIAGANNAFPATITRWLPGTIFQIGGQEAYTLRARPTSLGGNNGYLFDFEECIGSGNQNSVFVLEPNVARQTLPYLWGPNEQGYVFGCGDPLRPGVVQWCKAFTPDSVPTAYDLELCPPSEPLLGGEVMSGVSLVASSLRWWALYFQSGGKPLFSQVEVPVGRRLAAPFGKCTDGKLLYFWATDCIAATAGTGAAISLTDTDLYNLFPHGGMSGSNVVRGPVTFYAPDYSRAATFRIAVREGIIYAVYQDSSGTQRMLIGQLKDEGVAWSTDTYVDSITTAYAIEQPKGTLTLAPSLYPAVVMGTNGGKVFKFQDFTGDNNSAIDGFVYTPEWNGGDIRSNGLWGDQYVDVLAPNGLTVTPVTEGAAVANNSTISASDSRQFQVVSLDGGLLLNFLGLQFAWSDYANSNQTVPTQLNAWQPSVSDQIETTTDRASDWTDCGTPDNKFFQGILLDADTFNNVKDLVIVDADTGASHALQPTVQHNGRQTIPYSFATPFLAHSVKDVPQDKVAWRRFNIKYVFEPTPESVDTWITQWTALGSKGYKHIPRIEASYSSTTPVTLVINSYDGTSPATLTLPSTSGVTKKVLLTLTRNKGQLYRFSATSPSPFQMFEEDFLVWVFDWGRPADARPYNPLGGHFGDGARI